jgi:outer membrane protein assembly factor BamB
LVWYGGVSNGGLDGKVVGRDLRTGKIKKSFPADVKTFWFHHRCHRGKATKNYLLTSRTGIEFIDIDKKTWGINHWVRGGCLYGIMPANGLIYTPPHACACYLESKQFGLNALAPARPVTIDSTNRLIKGPALGKMGDAGKTGEWPTYRHDGKRSGNASSSVPKDLTTSWTTTLDGRLSPITVAAGRVFVAQIDSHTVHAMDAKTGDTVWSYVTGARVDSPPTIYKGLAYFGSADGWVYAVQASDGQLAWRFRAAPEDRMIPFLEQLESPWPVHGSVLIQDGVLYAIAGRSMFVDGGIWFHKIDPETGNVLQTVHMDDRKPEGKDDLHADVKWLNMPVAKPDILSTDGEHLYMRSQMMTMDGKRLEMAPVGKSGHEIAPKQGPGGRHLFSPTSLLDGSYFHRSYWVYGRRFTGGWYGYPLTGKFTPSGKILVFDDKSVYGFGRKPQYYRWTTPMEHQLFAASTSPAVHKPKPKTKAAPAKKGKDKKKKSPAQNKNFHVKHDWTTDVPILVRAMLKQGDTLVIAGPPDVMNEQEVFKKYEASKKKIVAQQAALDGKKGGSLVVVSTTDGKTISKLQLASPPVWDGIAAAYGSVFMATQDGKIIRFGE